MIDDLIERAFAHGIVRAVVADADGCDRYLLARGGDSPPDESPITVWVRPDGRFSRAAGAGGLLSLGQVMALCALGRDRPAAPTAVHRHTRQQAVTGGGLERTT